MMHRTFRDLGVVLRHPSITVASPPLMSEPQVFTVADESHVVGHGFGHDQNTVCSAYGEYYERLIAYRTVSNVTASTISQLGLPIEAKNAIEIALTQTALQKTQIAEHKFKTCMVEDLKTKKLYRYPSIVFSLNNSSNDLDQPFVPVRDSSGSAAHVSREKAFDGALLEFVERQCTTAMWVSRRCNAIVTLNKNSLPIKISTKLSPESLLIANLLRSQGTLRIFDISYLSGANVVFCDFNADNASNLLSFACGASAHWQYETALQKAILETWQTSLLRCQSQFFTSREYGSSDLVDNFMTGDIAGNDEIKVDPITIGSATQENGLNADLLLSYVLTVSQHVYAYEHEFHHDHTKLYFFKIFSPDYFIHMNAGDNNNDDNPWIRRFGDPSEMRLTPMPFS